MSFRVQSRYVLSVGRNQLILDPGRAGNIYVKDIFFDREAKMHCAINLWDTQLIGDDRLMSRDVYDALANKVAGMWAACLGQPVPVAAAVAVAPVESGPPQHLVDGSSEEEDEEEEE